MKVADEAFRLASELTRRFPEKESYECNFAQEMAEFMNDDDYLYELPETPHYLERSGLAEIQSTDLFYAPNDYLFRGAIKVAGDISQLHKPRGERTLSFQHSLSRSNLVVKGFFAISFDIQALKIWFEKHLESKTGTISGVTMNVPEGWQWLNEARGIYQFGALGRFDQGRGEIGKIFRAAMNLFEETPQAISIGSLSKQTSIGKKVLRTRLHEINKKLRKLGLEFVGGGGYYRIESVNKTKTEPFSE
jgi:hypothetical protein